MASGVAQQELTTTTRSSSLSSGTVLSTSAATQDKTAGRHTRKATNGTTSTARREGRGGDPARDWHRPKPEEFRSYMQTELAANPALNKRVVRLSEIQARRQALQKKRQAAAGQTTASRDVVIKKFHTLLREDMELSDRARQIAREIVNDMPRIKKQLDERRNSLNSSLAAAEKADADANTSSTAARDLRRRLHYLDFLERKLDDIKDHPERLDLLARVLRGAPPDEPPLREYPDNSAKRDANARQRPPDGSGRSAGLDQLKRRRRQLQRELRNIEAQIEKQEK
jgi:hypothetical protein